MENVVVIGSGNAFNTDGRGHTCFLLDSRILIDCGATILQKVESLKIDISKVDVVLVTHFHGDHYGGIPFLLIYYKYILRRERPLFLAGPEGIEVKYKELLNLFYPEMEFPYEIKFVKISSIYTFDKYYIQALPITHKEESVGYRILDEEHSFAFTGDTILNEQVYELLYNVDIGIMELSLWNNSEKKVMHVSLEELLVSRKRIKVKKLFFNHITNAIAEKIKEISKKDPSFGIPLEDGMIIPF